MHDVRVVNDGGALPFPNHACWTRTGMAFGDETSSFQTLPMSIQ